MSQVPGGRSALFTGRDRLSGIDTRGFVSASRDILRQNMVVEGLTGSFRQLGITGNQVVTRLRQGFVIAFSTAIVGAFAAQLLRVQDSILGITSLLRANRVAASDVREVYDSISQISIETFNSIDSTGRLFARLNRAAGQYGLTQQQTLQVTRSFQQSLVLSGANTQEATSAAIQFSQAIGAARLGGDELRSVLENNSFYANLIAESFGVTVAQFRILAGRGDISVEAILRNTLTLGDRVDRVFGNISITADRAFQNLRTGVVEFFGRLSQAGGPINAIIERINDIGVSLARVSRDPEALREILDRVNEIIDSIVSGLRAVAFVVASRIAIGVIGTFFRLSSSLSGILTTLNGIRNSLIAIAAIPIGASITAAVGGGVAASGLLSSATAGAAGAGGFTALRSAASGTTGRGILGVGSRALIASVTSPPILATLLTATIAYLGFDYFRDLIRNIRGTSEAFTESNESLRQQEVQTELLREAITSQGQGVFLGEETQRQDFGLDTLLRNAVTNLANFSQIPELPSFDRTTDRLSIANEILIENLIQQNETLRNFLSGDLVNIRGEAIDPATITAQSREEFRENSVAAYLRSLGIIDTDERVTDVISLVDRVNSEIQANIEQIRQTDLTLRETQRLLNIIGTATESSDLGRFLSGDLIDRQGRPLEGAAFDEAFGSTLEELITERILSLGVPLENVRAALSILNSTISENTSAQDRLEQMQQQEQLEIEQRRERAIAGQQAFARDRIPITSRFGTEAIGDSDDARRAIAEGFFSSGVFVNPEISGFTSNIASEFQAIEQIDFASGAMNAFTRLEIQSVATASLISEALGSSFDSLNRAGLISFEQYKRIAIAQAVISTSLGVLAITADPLIPTTQKPYLIAAQLVLGAAQLTAIRAAEPGGGSIASGGNLPTASTTVLGSLAQINRNNAIQATQQFSSDVTLPTGTGGNQGTNLYISNLNTNTNIGFGNGAMETADAVSPEVASAVVQGLSQFGNPRGRVA